MLRGTLSGASALGGSISASGGLGGSLTVGGGAGYPVYDGETEWVPSESEQTIGTHGKAVLTDIIVDAVPSGYVGSAVPRRDATDLTASGATVTAPAGYYAEGASKAVASGSITMRRPTMDEAVGEVRSRADLTTGYVTGGSYSGSALILDKQAGATITPTESEQVAVAQYRWTTGDVKVAAIPSQYIVPTGTYTVTGSGTHDVTDYASASVASATPTNSSESEYITSSGARKWRYRPKTIVPTAGWADQHSASNPINGFWSTYDAIPTGTTVTPTTSAQTIGGADTMMEGAVTVAAIPPEYIVPTGTKAISANGTGIDVTGYAAVDVAVPTFDALSWLGEGAEVVATYAEESTALSATTYASWTPSTTAKTIKSGATAGTYAVDMDEYDYLIRWQFYCEPVYGSGATNTARFVKTVQEIYQAVIRRPGSLAYIGSLTDSSNACQTVNTPSLMHYYNASGSNTYTWAASYGVYASATAATFASSTATSTTLTVKRPAISARCSTTYFSTGNAGAVTQASTYIRTRGWLYRIEKSKSLAYNQYRNVCTIFDNGF